MPEIKRIFQVEDDAGVVKLVNLFLSQEGIKVDLATSMRDAARRLGCYDGFEGLRAYDGLLLDMGLPDGKGSDIARMVRANSDTPNIVMFSGSDFASAVEETRGLPNVYYLNKPSPLRLILSALEGRYTAVQN